MSDDLHEVGGRPAVVTTEPAGEAVAELGSWAPRRRGCWPCVEYARPAPAASGAVGHRLLSVWPGRRRAAGPGHGLTRVTRPAEGAAAGPYQPQASLNRRPIKPGVRLSVGLTLNARVLVGTLTNGLSGRRRGVGTARADTAGATLSEIIYKLKNIHTFLTDGGDKVRDSRRLYGNQWARVWDSKEPVSARCRRHNGPKSVTFLKLHPFKGKRTRQLIRANRIITSRGLWAGGLCHHRAVTDLCPFFGRQDKSGAGRVGGGDRLGRRPDGAADRRAHHRQVLRGGPPVRVPRVGLPLGDGAADGSSGAPTAALPAVTGAPPRRRLSHTHTDRQCAGAVIRGTGAARVAPRRPPCRHQTSRVGELETHAQLSREPVQRERRDDVCRGAAQLE